MPVICRDVQRRAPLHRLKIDVTVCCNELFRDGRMPLMSRDVERRALSTCKAICSRAHGGTFTHVCQLEILSFVRVRVRVVCVC